MHDWLVEAASRFAGKVYLKTPGGGVTFGEMGELVGGVVEATQDLAPDARIGVWAANDTESVAAILGVPRSGRIPLLLNPSWTPEEAAGILDTAGAAAVIGTGPQLGYPRITAITRSRFSASEVEPLSTHSVVFTSGTTGPPKGVRLTWANLEASAAASAHHLSHVGSDQWLCVLPVCHVGGLAILIRSLRQGSTVVLEPEFDAAAAARHLTGDVTLASLVAASLRAVLDEPVEFAGVRHVLVGGGPVPITMVEEARRRGLPALATYGMTETASQVATADPDAPPTPWLQRLSSVELRIVGGRIAVRGPMVSPGYLDEPDRADEWFVTGDAGTVIDSRLRVEGRADDVIVTGGENVGPHEVEAVLRSLPGVSDVVVVGVPDQQWGSVVGCLIVLGPIASVDAVAASARSRLASYAVPRVWREVHELPLSGIGKPDRQAAVRLLSEVDPPQPGERPPSATGPSR